MPMFFFLLFYPSPFYWLRSYPERVKPPRTNITRHNRPNIPHDGGHVACLVSRCGAPVDHKGAGGRREHVGGEAARLVLQDESAGEVEGVRVKVGVWRETLKGKESEKRKEKILILIEILVQM